MKPLHVTLIALSLWALVYVLFVLIAPALAPMPRLPLNEPFIIITSSPTEEHALVCSMDKNCMDVLSLDYFESLTNR